MTRTILSLDEYKELVEIAELWTVTIMPPHITAAYLERVAQKHRDKLNRKNIRTYKTMETLFFKAVRGELLFGLLLCTEKQQSFFKRMYGNNQEQPLEKVVAKMARGKLDNAMDQVKRTLEKNERNNNAHSND